MNSQLYGNRDWDKVWACRNAFFKKLQAAVSWAEGLGYRVCVLQSSVLPGETIMEAEIHFQDIAKQTQWHQMQTNRNKLFVVVYDMVEDEITIVWRARTESPIRIHFSPTGKSLYIEVAKPPIFQSTKGQTLYQFSLSKKTMRKRPIGAKGKWESVDSTPLVLNEGCMQLL